MNTNLLAFVIIALNVSIFSDTVASVANSERGSESGECKTAALLVSVALLKF